MRSRPGTANPSPSRRATRQSTLTPGALITAVTMDARDPSVVHVRIGRRSAAKIDASIAAELDLQEGLALDEHTIEAILRAQLLTDARHWALRILSRRAISRGMLISKLEQKLRNAERRNSRGAGGTGAGGTGAGGIGLPTGRSSDASAPIRLPRADLERLADDLARKGFLDDRRYAESVAAAEIRRKPAGSRLIETKLRAKRIDAKLAREIASHTVSEDRARREDRGEHKNAAALELARRKMRTLSNRVDPDTAARRIYGLLARRGFDPDVCREVTRRVVRSDQQGADQ